MSQASELIATQMASAANIAKIWNFLYNVKAAPYNAKGDGSDDTNAIQKAINAAIAANSKSVFFPSGTYSATILTNTDKVVFIGDNATLTVGGSVVPIAQLGISQEQEIRSSILYDKALDDIANVPSDSLLQAKSAVLLRKELRIAFWGDSITEGADQISSNDAYTSKLTSELKNMFPGVTVNNGNFSLGSRNSVQAAQSTYNGLASEPSDLSTGFYRAVPWGDGAGSVVGKAWRDHIKDYRPDLLVIAFGMNDAGGDASDISVQQSVASMIAYAQTWPVAPSIVLVTSIMSTKDTTRYFERQDILNNVNRAVREYGKNSGVVVADANRLYQILLSGIDQVARAHYLEQNWSNYTTDWSGATSSYTLSGSTLTPVAGQTNKLITRSRPFYNGSMEFDVTPLATGANGWVYISYRRTSDLGSMTLVVQPGNAADGIIALYTGDSGGSPSASISGLTIPTGSSSKIRLEAYGAIHKVYLNGVLQLTFTTYKELNDGAIDMGGTAQLPTFTNLKIGYADSLTGSGVYTENDLLGSYNSIQSGNGMNHPSGLAHSLVYFASFTGVIKDIKNATKLTTLRTLGNLTYYISPTGDDNNSGLSASSPLKTWVKVALLLPQTINHTVTINAAEGTYTDPIVFNSYSGNGRINVIGGSSLANSATYLVPSATLNNNSIPITVQGFRFTDTAGQSVMSANYTRGFIFKFCSTVVTSASYGFFGSEVTGTITNCDINNRFVAVSARTNSVVYADTLTGIGNTYAYEALQVTTMGRNGTPITGPTNIDVTSVLR